MLFKERRDPRVTRVGRVLRRLSIDELPQLFNVAAGRHVPRRPPPAAAAARSTPTSRTPFSACGFVPGMTGLWQVSGRSDLS